MNFRQHSQLPPVHLALINFIDILLVLTIFLMSNFALSPQETSLQVNLPKSSAQAPSQPKRSSMVVVNIGRDGTIVINGKTVSIQEMGQTLTRLKSVMPDTIVVLRADSQAPYQTVLNVIELCGTLKLNQISFAAKKG